MLMSSLEVQFLMFENQAEKKPTQKQETFSSSKSLNGCESANKCEGSRKTRIGSVWQLQPRTVSHVPLNVGGKKLHYEECDRTELRLFS